MRLIRKAGVTAVLVALAVGLTGCSYNTFVSQDEAIKSRWAEVENQLQRRNDLIPNLVETVKGTAQQEKDVFGQIADSRAKLSGATTPEQRMQAANEQSTALARLLVVVENYPELKSNASFNRLMDELAGTENRLVGRPYAVQRAGAAVQHVTAPVSVERDGGHLRIQGASAVQRTARSRAPAKSQLREQVLAADAEVRCHSSIRCCPSSTMR